MARHEEDREDLYAEFRSAVQKWEFTTRGFETPIVAGIRKDGRFSLYFDQDHCYHFNTQSQLIRAYVAGSLYRTQGTTLARLTRQRTEEATVLLRHDLTESELCSFNEPLEEAMQKLSAAVKDHQFEVLRSKPHDLELNDFSERLLKLSEASVKLAPPFPTKRK